VPRDIVKIPSHLEASAIQAALATFPPDNPYGVTGARISTKVRDGRRLNYKTLCVQVPHKDCEPEVPVCAVEFDFGGITYSIRPDVIATGSPVRAASGSSPVFSGLHPGAAIVVQNRGDRTGGVCCLLSAGGRGEPTHLVTAGHLFREGARDTEVWAAPVAGAPRRIGHLRHNLLDALGNSRKPRDAAIVELDDAGLQLARSTPSGRHSLCGVVSEGLLHLQRATAFLPTLGDYGNDVTTYMELTFEHIRVPSRDRVFTVSDYIRTSASTSAPGDSGTVLCTHRQPREALGSCIGGHGRSSLFEPLDIVLREARTLMQQELSLWSP
jgi:hypothetical protein